ncbi:MAG: hypothetical protein U5L72_09755 [Bacteroidales bacterium]|nr:hypothetical protein [Bacteroidales bacterium]
MKICIPCSTLFSVESHRYSILVGFRLVIHSALGTGTADDPMPGHIDGNGSYMTATNVNANCDILK